MLVDRPGGARNRLLDGFLRRGLQVQAVDVWSPGGAADGHVAAHALVTVEIELLGVEWASALGEIHACLPGAELVVCTTRGSLRAAIRSVRAGATSFLLKPVTADQVLLEVGWLDAELVGDLDHPSYHRAVWEYVVQCRDLAPSIAEASRRLGLAPRSLRRMLRRSPPTR